MSTVTHLPRSRVLVTGATGFVGTALLSRLRLDRSIRLGAVVRRSDAVVPDGVETVVMQALLDADTRRDQPQPLADVRAILHCAARVHVMQDAAADPVAEYRRVNVDLTLALAQMAAAAGVPQCHWVNT